MSGIGNPALQAKLQEHNMQWVNSLRTTIAKHEGGERFTYYSNNMNASALSARNIGLQIGGVNGMQAGVAIIEGLRETGKSLLGWDDTMADNWIREQKSAIFDALIKDCIDRGDTAGQQALVDIFGGDVNGQSLLGAKSKLAVIQEQQDAVKMLDDAIKAHPEWIVDGILDEAKVSEWIENNYGQNAPDRIERVLVGGGGSINTIDGLMAAISGQESGGNYDAQNGRTGAYGKYQIMPGNWPSWSEEAGLGSNAERTPENQEKVARFKLNQYLQQYGAEGAMVAWYSGPGNAERWVNGETTDVYGRSWDAKNGNGDEPSIREYVQQVSARGGKGGSIPNLADVVTLNNGSVNIDNMNPLTAQKVAILAQRVYDKYQFKLNLTEGWADGTGHDDGSWHYSGQAVDIAQDELKDPKVRKDVIRMAKELNLVELDEYETRSANWTGDHVHFSDHGDPLPEGASGGSHYVERKVSGYNPVMRDAMMARAKQAVANYKSDNTRKFNSYRDMLKQLPEVQNARDISEFRTVFQRYGVPQYMWDSLASAIGFDMKANISHENRVEADKNKAQREAAESVNAYILNEERNGRSVTADSLFTIPGFSGMSSGNQRSMYEHMKQAEATSDAHIGWYKGETKDAFESAVSSMKKSNGLDEMWVPNLRAGISAANMERKKKGEPAMSPAEIQQYVAGQAMNWKVKGRLWGENSSDQMRAALLPGQYISEDGRTVYDADGTELVWDEDMKMYRRP
jgi:hypothetical protein